MKAGKIHYFGSPNAIVIDEIRCPTPEEGELVVRVAAAGVGPWDAFIREEKVLCNRPFRSFSGQIWRPHSGPRRLLPRFLDHLVSHPAKEEGIGLFEVLDRVTMQVFVHDRCSMIAAAVQCNVDGIPKLVSLPKSNAGRFRRLDLT